MKIYEEKDVRDFGFWSGADDLAEKLTDSDWDIVEVELEMMYPDGIEDVHLNDIFRFEGDWIAQLLGYENEEDFDRKRDPDYLDDDQLSEYAVDWFRDYVDSKFANGDWSDLTELYDETHYEDCEVLVENDDEKMEIDGCIQYPEWLVQRVVDKFHSLDAEDIMEMFFEDDRGHDAIIDFPTKEDFRDEMMIKHKNS